MVPNPTPNRHPRIIDCHGHVNWREYDADRVVENMDAHGIDLMWVLTWETTLQEAGESAKRTFAPGRVGMPLEDILEAAGKHPGRLVPFYAPDPRRPGAMDRLRRAVEENGVRGFGELKVRMTLDDPRAIELFHYCGENQLPVTFHMETPLRRSDPKRRSALSYCCDWENLAHALEVCSQTIFLGHSPGFWREISGDAEESEKMYPAGPVVPGGKVWEYLDKYSNLYCDLSARSALNALSRDSQVGKEFLVKYQDRCLFGRDCFDDALMTFLKSCELPEPVMEKILCGNALKLVPV